MSGRMVGARWRSAPAGRARMADVIGFWDRVSQLLDTVEQLPDREAVEKIIATRVPRPVDGGSR